MSPSGSKQARENDAQGTERASGLRPKPWAMTRNTQWPILSCLHSPFGVPEGVTVATAENWVELKFQTTVNSCLSVRGVKRKKLTWTWSI